MTVRGADYKRVKNDNYPTPPEVVETLLKLERFNERVCDPAAGKGEHILNVLKAHGYKAFGMDIIHGVDFVTVPFRQKNCDIVTNPPYGDRKGSLSLRFIEKSLEVTKPWRGMVAMLLPVDFDSGKLRRHVFADCPAFAHKIILLDRIKWFNGKSGSTNHAWFIWDWARDMSDRPTIGYTRIE